MLRLGWLLVAAVAISGCGGAKSGNDPVFIALGSDFTAFRDWPKTALGDTPIQGHPAGPRFAYRKELPGPTEYPVGAIIVKTVERDTTPQSWDIFAMAKRGGDFNPGGAVNWEFFTLKINADNVPVIADRGQSPVDADTDGGAGHGYTDSNGNALSCNSCHGVAGTERTDHILSPLLAPPGK